MVARTGMTQAARPRVLNRIFVTGAPRSGTTFVGQMLSLPLSVDYIHEPFNRGELPGFNRRFRYLRPHDTSPDTAEYRNSVARVLAYDFRVRTTIPDEDPAPRKAVKRVLGDRGAFYLRWARLNPFRSAVVLKDPTAAFLGAYLSEHFGVRPVTVVKHPVALAAGLRRLGWVPSPKWFLEQSDLLAEYGDEVEPLLRLDWNVPLIAAAAHWRIVYGVQLAQARQAVSSARPWIVCLIETLSENPVQEFQCLYADLSLPWSEGVAKRIEKATSGQCGEARRGQVQDLKRDAAKIFEVRRQQLTKEERRQVLDITAPLALQFYGEESFAV